MSEEQTKRLLAAIESIAASLRIFVHPLVPPPPTMDESMNCACKTCVAHRAWIATWTAHP